jgi:16S rRNA (uracil1498-N3)-methyltransferase
MRRFFVEEINEVSKEVDIQGPEFAHLKKVLRLGKGAPVSVFNGQGLELYGRVESMGRAKAVVKIEGRVENKLESPVEVVLIQGLVKGAKPEFIVQKATELGATTVRFFGADRAVPGMRGGRLAARLSRWRRVAIEAAKQCGRQVVPGLELVPDIKSAVLEVEGLLKLQPHVPGPDKGTEGVKSLKEVLASPFKDKGVAILVGPEGGFTDAELEIAGHAGFRPVSLGPRTLRAETAAVAVLSIVLYELGG